MKFLIFFICFFASHFLAASGVFFEHSVNKITDQKMHSFQVLGERCSGTNFLNTLIGNNFPNASRLKFLESTRLNKHFIPWLFDEASVYKHLYYPFPSENVLYVVVIRNVFDWVRSFYREPHHMNESQNKNGFTGFITQIWTPKDCSAYFQSLNPWEVILGEPGYKNGDMLCSLIDGEDPLTHKPFENILQLRARKYQNYLRLGNFVNNVIYVKYEDVNNDPQGFVNYLANFFEGRAESFVPVLTYKGFNKEKYIPKTYAYLEDADKKFMLAEMDLDLEASFGYEY